MGFIEAVKKVIKNEGGSKYTNIEGDKGSHTRFGVTIAALNEYYQQMGLNDATADDVQNMTEDTAIEIYKKNYWDKHNVESLPVTDTLKFDYFDSCVNHGGRFANMILQQAAVGRGKNIDADGILGPQSLEAIESSNLSPLHFRVERSGFMWNNVFDGSRFKKRNNQSKFIVGWVKRVFHMDDIARSPLDEYSDQELGDELRSRMSEEELENFF